MKKEQTERKCETCGKTCKGRKVCASCSAKKNGLKTAQVMFKVLPEGFANAQAVFNWAVKQLKDSPNSSPKTEEEILAGVIAWGKQNGISETEKRIQIDDELDSLTD